MKSLLTMAVARNYCRLSMILVGSSLTFWSGQANAQASSEETIEQVVVTGSRITRRDFASPSPLVTTEMEDVSTSGKATIDDFLRNLPQFGPGTGDFSNDSNGGTAGRATLNLRNLGAKRNLVIMDGRRLISSGTDGAIDINTIPSLAIGNIEVITGGASATYGSDALSGVVNFRTRTDLDGFEIDAQGSTLDDAGENNYRLGVAYGTDYADGRGNLLLTAEFNERGGVRYREREFFAVNPQHSTFIVHGHTRIGRNIWSVNDDGTVFDAGDIDHPARPFTGQAELPLLIRGDDLRTHGQYQNWIQVPLEQRNIFAKTDYELDNGVTAYGHVLSSSSTALNEGAAPNSAGIWGVTIPQDNYYLQQIPFLADRVGPAGILNNQRRFFQAGGRVYETDNDVLQVLGGLRGEFADRDLNWDIHWSRGSTSTEDRTTSGSVSFAAVQDIIDSTDPATGVSPLCSGGFNPFGGTTPLSPACLEFVSRTPVNETTLEQTVLEGVLEGKLADMPAGEARFALTGHYRENTYEFDPDPDIAAGNLANLASSGFTTGDVEALEIAGEVLLPLIADSEAIQSMNLTLGLRLSDYDPAGSNQTWKAEIDAQVTDDFMLRGGLQHAVRAPNVEEFFRASLLRVQPFLDPCSSRYRGVSTDRAAELALCAEQGADRRYTQGGSSAPTFTNGNPALTPEEADTFTVGAVYEFEMGDANVQLSVDYYNIEVDDAIETLFAQQVMTKCFNLDGTSNPTYDNNYFPCQQIHRPILAPATTAFDLDPVNQPVLNLGGIKTAGVDVAAGIDVPVEALAWGGGAGRVALQTGVTFLNQHEIQAFSDEQFVDFAGVVSGNVAYPETKAFTTLTIETGPLQFNAMWQHISDMVDISAAGGVASTIPGADAYDYLDLTGLLTINDQLEIYAGINNVFDELPPQIGGEAVGSNFSGTNQGVYDAIGRATYLGVRTRF